MLQVHQRGGDSGECHSTQTVHLQGQGTVSFSQPVLPRGNRVVKAVAQEELALLPLTLHRLRPRSLASRCVASDPSR